MKDKCNNTQRAGSAGTRPTHQEMEERVRRAYFRRYGIHADQPGWVKIRGKYVTLGNVRGPLARFEFVKGEKGFRLRHIDEAGAIR